MDQNQKLSKVQNLLCSVIHHFKVILTLLYVSTVSVYDEVNMDLFGAGFRYFVTNEIAVGLGLTLEQDQLRKNLKMVMKLNLHRQHLEWLLMQIIISKR